MVFISLDHWSVNHCTHQPAFPVRITCRGQIPDLHSLHSLFMFHWSSITCNRWPHFISVVSSAEDVSPYCILLFDELSTLQIFWFKFIFRSKLFCVVTPKAEHFFATWPISTKNFLPFSGHITQCTMKQAAGLKICTGLHLIAVKSLSLWPPCYILNQGSWCSSVTHISMALCKGTLSLDMQRSQVVSEM